MWQPQECLCNHKHAYANFFKKTVFLSLRLALCLSLNNLKLFPFKGERVEEIKNSREFMVQLLFSEDEKDLSKEGYFFII